MAGPPCKTDLPVTGFPALAIQPTLRRRTLSDGCLETIAREYLVRGRGYAVSLGRDHFVTPRTVISRVEKLANAAYSAPRLVEVPSVESCATSESPQTRSAGRCAMAGRNEILREPATATDAEVRAEEHELIITRGSSNPEIG